MPAPQARTYMLRVKMNAEERRHAEALARKVGLSVSALVRMLLQKERVRKR